MPIGDGPIPLSNVPVNLTYTILTTANANCYPSNCTCNMPYGGTPPPCPAHGGQLNGYIPVPAPIYGGHQIFPFPSPSFPTMCCGMCGQNVCVCGVNTGWIDDFFEEAQEAARRIQAERIAVALRELQEMEEDLQNG